MSPQPDRGRICALAMILGVSLAAIGLAGCLATINAVTAPSSIAVGENFAIAVDGSVSGKTPGAAALVIQVPDSFDYVRAMYVASSAKRRLRLQPAIARLFTPEPGHRILVLVDSIAFA